MTLKKLYKNDSGQILTSVIVFMAFGLSVIAISSVLTIINIQNTAKNSESAQALYYAEAGAEEGIMRLVRDPAYTQGTLLIDSASVSISVTGDLLNKVITSIARYNGFTKKIVVQVSLADGKVTLVSWREEI